MMRIFVSSEVDLPLKLFFAVVTRKRLNSGVFSGVSNKVATLTKRLVADGAHVGFLARVNIRVLFHVRLLMESLVTICAGVWSCVAVD